MSWLRVFASRLRALSARKRLDTQLDEEVQAHIDLLTEENRRKGMPPDEARYAALRSFGGVAQVKDEYRQARSLPLIETTWQDLRYAIRSLSKRPGFLFAAVFSLALGIGANTAIFSVLHAALLRPLPFENPRQLVLLFESAKGGRTPVSYPNLQDWRQQNHVFEDLSAVAGNSLNATGSPHAERLRGGFVSASFFRILDVQPFLGRGFKAEDDRPGAAKVAIISHAVWQRRFGADPGVLQKNITLNAEPYAIVGVLPAGFRFPIDEIEVWITAPHILSSQPAGTLDRGSRFFLVVGRLKDGVTPTQARANFETITTALAREYPKENEGRGALIVGLHDFLSGGFKLTLLILMGAVGIVLLIACANVANLMLARASQRERELAVRAALGAGRGRLARQLLLEGTVISVLGGAFGLLLAAFGIHALSSSGPTDVRFATEPGIDAVVLAFTLAVSCLVGILSSLLPAVRASRVDLNRAFQEGSASVTPLHGQRTRGFLIAAEVALSMVLLVGGGLLLQSLYSLLQVDFGFKPEKLLTMEYRLLRAKYKTRDDQWGFHRRVVEQVADLPGVQSAALTRAVPYSGNGGPVRFTPPSSQPLVEGEQPQAVLNTVTPDYFDTMGILLLKGRTCSASDTAGAPLVILINERLASRLWPDGDALGRRLELPEWGSTANVIGVVAGNRQNSLRQEPPWQIYACYSQNPGTYATIVVRTAGEPMALARAVQEVVWSVDGEQAVWKVRTVEDLIRLQTGHHHIVAFLTASFATVALALALIGIYGVVSYAVNQRTREVGIRIALGASRGSVLRLLLGGILSFVSAGITLGTAGALALTQTLSIFLYRITPTDTATLLGCALLLAGTAAVAAYTSARKAMRTDPVAALRYE